MDARKPDQPRPNYNHLVFVGLADSNSGAARVTSIRAWIRRFSGRVSRRICLLVGCSLSLAAYAQDSAKVSLAWDPSPGTNVSGYSVRFRAASQNYDSVLMVGNQLAATLENLAPGTDYTIVVTSWSWGGLESDPSNEVFVHTPGEPPNLPPTLNPIANLRLPVNPRPQTITLTGVTPGAPWEDQALTLAAVSSNPAIIPTPTIRFDPQYDTALLTLAPTTGAVGKVTITVTVDDGASRSNTISRSFRVQVGNPTYTTLFMEAEDGIVAAPMSLALSLQASGHAYISSSAPSAGSAAYSFNVSQADTYTVWCRVVSENSGTDSFFVGVDGQNEDVFDTGLEAYSGSWQWIRLNGRAFGLPRLLTLNGGQHTLVFKGRESGAHLDAIYITNDPDFVPVTLEIAPATSPAGAVALSFRSPAGYRYALQASDDYDFKRWTNIWQSTVAGANQLFKFVDPASPSKSKRFYRLQTQ